MWRNSVVLRKLQEASKSSVSRKVSNLEHRLGVALIVRTTRKISITDFGQTYLKSCRRVLAELVEAERLVEAYSKAPSGKLDTSNNPDFELIRRDFRQA